MAFSCLFGYIEQAFLGNKRKLIQHAWHKEEEYMKSSTLMSHDPKTKEIKSDSETDTLSH